MGRHWSTTHGTYTHRGPSSCNAKNKASKGQNRKIEEHQGNLVEIVTENNNSSELVMGVLSRFTTESTNTTTITVCGSTPESTDTTTI